VVLGMRTVPNWTRLEQLELAEPATPVSAAHTTAAAATARNSASLRGCGRLFFFSQRRGGGSTKELRVASTPLGRSVPPQSGGFSSLGGQQDAPQSGAWGPRAWWTIRGTFRLTLLVDCVAYSCRCDTMYTQAPRATYWCILNL
jgi:hypothetical protein